MFNDYDKRMYFGQYKGLSIKEIYRGTLKIDKGLFKDYLDKILNDSNLDDGIFLEIELIEKFDITEGTIKIIGEIHDPGKPLTPANRIVFGNIQNNLVAYINKHFNDNFLGILQDIRKFNKSQTESLQIGADPEYLEWCERNVNDFQLSTNCKRELEKSPIARLKGVQVLYIGQETYEYVPQFSIEEYSFKFSD